MQTKEWHPIPTDALKAARDRLDLSYEGAARALGVSSKTYERYEKAGRVPLDLAAEIVHTLGIDVEHVPDVKLRLVASLSNGAEPTTSEVLVIVRRTAEAVESLTVALGMLASRLPVAPVVPRSAEEVARSS